VERGGEHAAAAEALMSQMRLGNVKSFGSFGDALYEFNFSGNVNFQTQPGAARLIQSF
jgi:hypothetical protein